MSCNLKEDLTGSNETCKQEQFEPFIIYTLYFKGV